MVQTAASPLSHGNEIHEKVRSFLASLGRGLGTVAVYGTEHPSVEQIIDKAFDALHDALQNRKSITIGTFNGTLTVNEEPVIARDVTVRTLEKRLSAMKVSHLSLSNRLTRTELKKLLTALCAPSDTQMKETLSEIGTDHVEMSDVKYVALRDGEHKTGKGGKGKSGGGESSSGADEIPSVNVSQIVAFLKGEPAGSEAASEVKKMLSDPERLGQMIMEAAAIRQSAIAGQDGESLADVMIGCLRRTYDGLRKEKEFKSQKGKVNLNKAMMLLEKNVLDKIHHMLGAQHPDVDSRILDAIREMEEEQQFEMLSAQYFEQQRKLDQAEAKLVESIKKQGEEKTREQIGASDVPLQDWQRLMVQAGVAPANNDGTGIGSGFDMTTLAVVLEKLEGLMQIDSSDPAQVNTTVNDMRNGFSDYTDRIESRIKELEGQVELHNRTPVTVEDHAEHLNREALMLKVSELTLALLQPLTVVNASIEAAMRQTEAEIQKDMLDLALESGKRMQSLTSRMMLLVGYPVLERK